MGAIDFIKNIKIPNPFKGGANKSEPTAVEVIQNPNWSTVRMFGMGTTMDQTDYTNTFNVIDALAKCPPVTYILYKKALAFINGQLEIKNLRTGLLMEDVTKYRHYKLLQTPNVLQSDIQFRINIKMMIEAFGYCPVLKIRPETMRSEITALWVLPPHLCKFTKSGKLLKQTKYSELWDKMEFEVFGTKTTLNKEDVYVFTDITPYFNSQLLPESRLQSCAGAIDAIKANYEARIELLENRGPLGVLVNDSQGQVPFLAGGDERENLERDMKRYGLNRGQRKIIMTSASLRWEQMGYELKDMMLDTQEIHDSKTVSAALGYPFELLPHGEASKYNNDLSKSRQLYEDSIIPETLNYTQQLNDCLESAKDMVSINYSFAHVTALQADKRLSAMTARIASQTAREEYKDNAITYNQMLVAIGREEVANGGYYYRDSPEYKLILSQQNNTPNGQA